MAEQNTLRGALTSAFDDAESGATDTIQPTEQTAAPEVVAQPSDTGRVRDEAGRFAPKAAEVPAVVDAAPKPLDATAAPAVVPPDDLLRPTTWKKEYMPMWEKLATGQQLTPDEAKSFLKYVANQRENEYKTGVSTYKQEAERARELHAALEPFMPTLQRFQIAPAAWIKQMGQAHQVLALGSPQQKAQAFIQLATDNGVDLASLVQGQDGQQQAHPQVAALLQEIQQLKGTVTAVDSWRRQEQDQKVASAIGELANDAANYPHFEAVKGTMAQLLESGLAQDLKGAYAKAIRMDEAVWQQEQTRLSQAATAEAAKKAAVESARRNAISVRTTTPSGVTKTSDAKDRRSVLAEQVEAAEGRV